MSLSGEPISDADTRVRIARREAAQFLEGPKIGGWICALGSGAIVAAMGFMGLPLWATVGAATMLVILSLYSIALFIGHRLYVQNAYTEMTVDHIESEAKEARGKIEGIEYTVARIWKRLQPDA
jgi:hypothetical protein